MKAKFILLISTISLILFSTSVFACISIPNIEFKKECPYSHFEFYNDNESISEQINRIQNECNISLTNDDIEIIRDFITNGYSIKEQTQEEYNQFLETANEANNGRPEECLAYKAVSYNGERWTGYIRTGYAFSETGGCAVPLCGGSPNINIIWNDLKNQLFIPFWIKITGLILVVGIVIISIVKIRRK